MENRKINAETKSHGNKLSTRKNAFHQLFHVCCNYPGPLWQRTSGTNRNCHESPSSDNLSNRIPGTKLNTIWYRRAISYKRPKQCNSTQLVIG